MHRDKKNSKHINGDHIGGFVIGVGLAAVCGLVAWLTQSGTPQEQSNENKGHPAASQSHEEVHTASTATTCIVCMEEPVSCALLPCRHHALCPACAAQLTLCPLCRTPVEQRLPLYSA